MRVESPGVSATTLCTKVGSISVATLKVYGLAARGRVAQRLAHGADGREGRDLDAVREDSVGRRAWPSSQAGFGEMTTTAPAS